MTGVLTWKSKENIDGYVIEKKEDENWEHIVTISNPAIKELRIPGLDNWEEHRYRVKLFRFGPEGEVLLLDEKPQYLDIPFVFDTPVEGLVIGGSVKDAIRLKWKPAEEITGYIVEIKGEEDWRELTRINQITLCTYRISGLIPGTSYSFRVAAYLEQGDKFEKGPYSNITGSTKK